MGFGWSTHKIPGCWTGDSVRVLIYGFESVSNRPPARGLSHGVPNGLGFLRKIADASVRSQHGGDIAFIRISLAFVRFIRFDLFRRVFAFSIAPEPSFI